MVQLLGADASAKNLDNVQVVVGNNKEGDDKESSLKESKSCGQKDPGSIQVAGNGTEGDNKEAGLKSDPCNYVDRFFHH